MRFLSFGIWDTFHVYNGICCKMAARRKLSFADVAKNNAEILTQWLCNSDSQFHDSDKDPDEENNKSNLLHSEYEVKKIHLTSYIN